MLFLTLVILADDTISDCCEPTGYYQYIFGWQGPYEGNGCTGAGNNLRGYTYWPIPGYVSSLNISAVYLRMVTNNSGTVSMNINKVGNYPPSAADCADEPYTTGYTPPSSPNVEFQALLGGNIIADVKAKAGSQFGLGISGSGADKFFFSHWAYYPDDAWLILVTAVETEETPGPGGLVRAVLYDASGRPVADYGYVSEGFVPEMRGLKGGIYILVRGNEALKMVK
ncbi:MAG: hypothetical protein ABIN58_03045 [candidate division WOR-3 bacterium]